MTYLHLEKHLFKDSLKKWKILAPSYTQKTNSRERISMKKFLLKMQFLDACMGNLI